MSFGKETTPTISLSLKSRVEEILSGYLKGCDIVYPHGIQLDHAFRDDCYADAIQRGFDLKLLEKPLDVGIAIADTAYRHLDNYSTRVFIALWTGLIVHIDDEYEAYSEGLKEFFDRFARRESQRYHILDQLVTMTHEFPQHWGVVSSNLIMASQIDYLTSSILDNDIKGMEIQSSMAPRFPEFNRRLSGLSRAYCIMVFPPHLDLKIWIQVLPDLIHYCDHVNDLLSFFKEELAGETINYVSISANASGISKVQVLKELADETVQFYQRGSRLFQSAPEAWKAFRGFTAGYVGFHALSIRYKLGQLNL